MSFLEICLIAVGLAMDAFAVSICKGLNMKKINYLQGLIIALFFGFFQFLMPVIGFYLGSQFEHYIRNVDHFVIFGLLLILGVKMIVEAVKSKAENEGQNMQNLNANNLNTDSLDINFKNENNEVKNGVKNVDFTSDEKLNFGDLLVLSIATSLDALAVGITFALLEVNVFFSSAIIGVITAIISFLGVIIGNYFGAKFKKPAEITGGVILILIGLKVLLEHLGILAI